MKAITTKYYGATNFESSKIIAKDGDGNKAMVTFDHAFDVTGNHRRAALALCAKMGWEGDLIEGGTKEGNVYVFAGGERIANPTRAVRRGAKAA